MRTAIIGGGLIGLTTAQALLDRDQDVTVLEAREGVGLETSFANAGMLTPSMPEPWNGPGVFSQLLASLFSPRAPMRIRMHVLPSLMKWGFDFLRNSQAERYIATALDNYRLALYSLDRTLEISRRMNLAYHLAERGTLCIYRDEAELQERLALCQHLESYGLNMQEVSAGQAADIEPALRPVENYLVGGIWLPDDARGDAHLFCKGIAKAITEQGALIRTNVEVSRLIVDNGRMRGVETGDGMVAADRVIVAAGVYSPALLDTAGMALPVKPAKGYSITIDGSDFENLPDVAVFDDASHVVLTTFGERLRIVGTAEFAGFDKSLTPARIDYLYRALDLVLPELAPKVDRDNVFAWAGMRPMSSDGRPFIGPTGIDGLFVNSGHGPLGWTMAAGSANLLADLVVGRQPEIDAEPFRFAR